MADQWTYDKLRRRWVAAVPAPTEPMPTAVPHGTAYGDWPRCSWPSGCTIGVRDKPLCSPHSELVLAYGHAAVPDPGSGATPSWQRCRTCGVRGAMHSRLSEVEEAAALVWLEDNPDVVLEPPPASAATDRVQRVPDRVNVRSDATTEPHLVPMAEVQAALAAGVPEDKLADHLGPPPVSSPKVRNDAPATSRGAARQVAPSTTSQRGRILAVIVHAGDDGATDEEVLQRTGLQLNTVRPRRLELVEQGYVVDSGDTRPTASGAQAIVWLATLAGLQAVPDA